jgi:hypothetical protein
VRGRPSGATSGTADRPFDPIDFSHPESDGEISTFGADPFQFHFHSGRLGYNWDRDVVGNMSTSIDTIRVGTEEECSTEGAAAGVVDVTGLTLGDVEEFVGDDHEAVHLERQNGRTFVVADR